MFVMALNVPNGYEDVLQHKLEMVYASDFDMQWKYNPFVTIFIRKITIRNLNICN